MNERYHRSALNTSWLCKVQHDSSQIIKHVSTVCHSKRYVCWVRRCSLSTPTQMHNNGDARLDSDQRKIPPTQPAVFLECREEMRTLKLTELPLGLLQLLDLVLQEEHGHCERQQRQQLQLGRHYDSEQPHQIIQRGVWSVHAQRRKH